MVPSTFNSSALTSVTRNGSPVTFTAQTIKGVSYAFFQATTGSYQATYGGVVPAPTITQQPQSATVTAGQTATFSVIASGSGLTYQWQSQALGGSSFSNIAGATASSYTTAATLLADSGTQFRCIVSNSSGSVTTNIATLTVQPAPTGTSFVISKTLGTIRNNYTGWVGMTVQVGPSALTVTAVGRIIAPGNSGTHTVKIVKTATGTDLPGGSVSVATTGGTAGNFVYGTLTSPITLSANTVYYVVSQETSGGDQWYDYNTTVQTASAGRVTSAVYSSGSFYVTPGSTSQTYGPVDFRYK